jgi:hypothetical protein
MFRFAGSTGLFRGFSLDESLEFDNPYWSLGASLDLEVTDRNVLRFGSVYRDYNDLQSLLGGFVAITHEAW